MMVPLRPAHLHSSCRIGKVLHREAAVGNRTKFKVVKNNCAPPFTEAEFDIRWGCGIDEMADLIETAVAAGALDRSGSHLLLDGKSIGQGRERARGALLSDPELWVGAAERGNAAALASREPSAAAEVC